MFVVHFYENKKLLLTQLRENVPSIGENLKVKGQKGKIASITNIDEKHVHVQLEIEKVVVKSKFAVDPAKRKRR
jgi:hypothetical protein